MDMDHTLFTDIHMAPLKCNDALAHARQLQILKQSPIKGAWHTRNQLTRERVALHLSGTVLCRYFVY